MAGMQGISKTPPLLVLSTRKQMEQAPGWADEDPPVLPLGKAAECQECQRRENQSILSLFLSLSFCDFLFMFHRTTDMSFFKCTLSFLQIEISLYYIVKKITKNGTK